MPTLQAPARCHAIDQADGRMEGLLKDVDTVFFAAGVASVPRSIEDPVSDLLANTHSVLRLLDLSRRLDRPPAFVFCSSAAVYGTALSLPMREDHPKRPVSPYGVSKLAAEEYVALYAREFGVPAASTRPFSVYGPGQRKQVVYDLARRIGADATSLEVAGDADVSRDFVYVTDAARAVISVAKRAPLKGEAFNVASGLETTLSALVSALVDAAGSTIQVRFTGEVREGDPIRWCADIAALRALGHVPEVPFADGIRRTYDWVAQQNDLSA